MKKNKTEYILGDVMEGGHKLIEGYGSCPWFIVYRCENGSIRWEIDDDHYPPHFIQTLRLFDDLQSKIYSSIPFVWKQKRIEVGLARALYGGMTAPSLDEAKISFHEVSERVRHEVSVSARVCHVVSSLGVTLALGILAVIAFTCGMPDSLFPLILGPAAGAVGAALSILIRADVAAVPPLSTPMREFLCGVSRTLFGTACGLVLVFLMKANLALGQFARSDYAIAALCVLSGFSERYLPGLLAGLEKDPNKASEATSEPAPSAASSAPQG